MNKQNYPLFASHLDLCYRYWQQLLTPGDTVVDATCGNGKDTLRLAHLLFSLGNGGSIIGLDIQAQAIAITQERLTAELPKQWLEQVLLYEQSHAEFPPQLQPESIRLIVYNLGYLPGSDKVTKTLSCSTLESVGSALALLAPGGAITLTCYPGHPEGKEEESALLQFVSSLSPLKWNVCHHRWVNRINSPSLLLIQKLYRNNLKNRFLTASSAIAFEARLHCSTCSS